MHLHKEELKKMLEVLEKFPDVTAFEIEQEGGNGIGNILTMTFAQEINGQRGSFTTEISGVENW
jgi:hypothetical protein